MVTRTSIKYLHHQHFITTRAQIVYEALILGEDRSKIMDNNKSNKSKTRGLRLSLKLCIIFDSLKNYKHDKLLAPSSNYKNLNIESHLIV